MTKFIDVAGEAIKETGDFAAGLFHSAIENPINGITQIANKTGLTSIPELHIVNSDSTSFGGMLGNIAGSAADFYLLNKVGGSVMGNIGGNGIGGNMLRMGIMGGVYEGVLTPSNPNSNHFMWDRIAGAGSGFTTFAAMAGAGGLLDKTGLFAVPEARGLMGSITYGGATGVFGGVAHAEANAVLREGKAVPTWQELSGDVANYASFGAAFGAAGWGASKIDQAFNSRTTTIKANVDHEVTVQTDANGNPVRITETRPGANGWDDYLVRNTATKMTNGSWSSRARAFDRATSGTKHWVPTSKMDVQNISMQPDGIKVTDAQGYVRSYSEKGFSNRRPLDEPRVGDPDYVAPDTGMRVAKDGTEIQIDTKPGGRFQTFRTARGEAAAAYYDDAGKPDLVSMKADGHSVSFHKPDGNGHWKAYVDDQLYDFKGTVSVTGGETAPLITVTADGGKPVTFAPGQSIKPMSDLFGEANFVPGGTGHSFATVDAQGNVTLHQSNTAYERVVSINGNPFKGEGLIKAGDKIEWSLDVGDRYPVYENRTMTWNGKVKPNTAFDINGNNGTPVKVER